MHEPTLTIGLPVYNGEAFLAESINSVLTQDYTDLELVITDNASTDGTAAICREYAARDPRVRYRRNATNLGIAGNFNAAFAEARGRYFKWHAADDLIGPGHLSLCVAELNEIRA